MTDEMTRPDLSTARQQARDVVERPIASPVNRQTLARSVLSLADEVERLRDALRPFTRCPLYGHGNADPSKRRIDCADDQCMNPEHTVYVECTHPSHAAAAALASDPSTPSDPTP